MALIHEWKIETITANDADPITTWTANVGGNNMTNGGGSVRPLYKTNITPTGKPVLRFDGSNDTMQVASVTGSVKHLFIVAAYRPASPAANNAFWPLDGASYATDLNGDGTFEAASNVTFRRDGASTAAFLTNGQFAVYEALLTTAAANYLALASYVGTYFGAWDICYVAAYDAEVTGQTLVDLRASLKNTYIEAAPIDVSPLLNDGLLNNVPRSGLLAWHEADKIFDTGNVTAMPDLSLNARHLICTSSHPVLTPNIVNGLPVVNFDGTKSPLKFVGSVAAKHIFVVAAHQEASFPSGDLGYGGLFSGLSGGLGILTGNPSSSRFFDYNWDAAGTYDYRRRDVAFGEGDMQAAFSNALSIFEVSHSTGWALDGIQIGQDRDFTARKWKGYFFADLVYNRVLTAEERRMVYAYLAMRCHLWTRVSSGLNVWPFQPNWSHPLAVDKPGVLSSTAVSGANKSRSKGPKKKQFEPQFETRRSEEWDAAEAFWNEHYPNTQFVYRDYSFPVPRDVTCRFTSGIGGGADDHHDYNYRWQAVEI